MKLHKEQENIPVGCVPPTCQRYMFQLPPLDVSSSGSRVGPQVIKFEHVSNVDHEVSLAGVGP